MSPIAQTRRSHRKVRTGCLTCKARRKKCDEAKPSCRRCITAGFKCDGYADIIVAQLGVTRAERQRLRVFDEIDVWKECDTLLSKSSKSPSCHSASTKNSACLDLSPFTSPITSISGDSQADDSEAQSDRTRTSIESKLSFIRAPNALSELSRISDLEAHCYSYFRHNTVPRMATYFENCIWRIDLQHAALAVNNPALFKTVTALGAVHRRFCFGISREAFEYCAHAARLYNEAVAALDNLKSESMGGHQSTISACEALLGIFQGFQANPEASSKHVRSGIRAAVGKPLRLLHSEAWYYSSPSPPRVICGMMYELYCRASELFGEPALTHTPDYDSTQQGFTMPYIFESLNDMKNLLFSVVEEVWRRHRGIEDLSGRRVFLELYEDRLYDWTNACIRTLESGMVIEPTKFKAFNLLSLTQSALCVSVQGNMLTTDRRDMRPIPHLPLFTNGGDDFSEAAISLCEAVDQMRSIDNADLSYVKAIFERTLIKHKIFCFERHSMQMSNSRVDEMLNLWTIGKNVSEIEEIAVIESLGDIIPLNAVHVDISDIWRDKKKVAVRYFEPNQDGSYNWIQQFWSF